MFKSHKNSCAETSNIGKLWRAASFSDDADVFVFGQKRVAATVTRKVRVELQAAQRVIAANKSSGEKFNG